MFKDKKWHLKEDGAVPDEKYLKKLDAYAAYDSAVKERENAYKNLYDREEFSYDVNKDAMYDKLVQDYAENASKAAEDAMGRAVSLTGGYGNSYAQQVSQQTFQDYMGGLDAEADKLYDRALDRYLLQGDLLKEKYDLATDRVQETYADYAALVGAEEVKEPEDQASPADLSEYEYEVEGMNTAEDALTYIQSMADLGRISKEEAMYLIDNYARNLPKKADYEKRAENRDDSAYVADEKKGGGNLWGIDRNAKVTYTFADGNTDTLTLGQLFRRLVSEGMDRKEARKKVIKIQHDLGISKKGNE